MSIKNEKWRSYSEIYDISNMGRIRKKDRVSKSAPSGYLMTPTTRTETNPFYWLIKSRGRKAVYAVQAMKEVWPEVEFQPDTRWINSVRKQNAIDNEKLLGSGKNIKTGNPVKFKEKDTAKIPGRLRQCAGGCGRMITNYRCEACWREIRRENGEYSYPPPGYRSHVLDAIFK